MDSGQGFLEYMVLRVALCLGDNPESTLAMRSLLVVIDEELEDCSSWAGKWFGYCRTMWRGSTSVVDRRRVNEPGIHRLAK